MTNTTRDLASYGLRGRLPCVRAFQAARELGLPPDKLGSNSDGLKISRCQLGLFGFEEFGRKRIADLRLDSPPELRQALAEAATSGSIPCAEAWRIADELAVPRLLLGATANALAIRISRCQLGCFE